LHRGRIQRRAVFLLRAEGFPFTLTGL